MSKSIDFYKLFKPELTPKKMLEFGVFGGSYLGDTIKEFPQSWFNRAKISKTFNVELNYFQIRAGLSLKEWGKGGWIMKEDPRGWFQWYCRYTNGRRIPEIDKIQISRWRAFGQRHIGGIKKNCPKKFLVAAENKGGIFYNGLIVLFFKFKVQNTLLDNIK